MLALRIAEQKLRLEDVSTPVPNGEALVRVIKSGICGTDLELVKGYSGFSGTPGHEFVGVVENAADRPDLAGKRVVGEINAGCGFCGLCLSGDSRHCPERTVLGIVGRDGSHAEFLKLPSRNLFEVPDDITDEAAVFVEPLAAAVGITERVAIETDQPIAVIGDGKLGLLCSFVLALRSRNVVLFGRHLDKMDLAETRGIETVFEPMYEKFEPSFDRVVEASGSESGFAAALELVKPRGTVVLKSTYHGISKWDASRVVVNEISVVGSRCGRFEPALALLSSNQIQVTDLISEEFSLANGVAAFECAGAKGVLKVLLNMEQ